MDEIIFICDWTVVVVVRQFVYVTHGTGDWMMLIMMMMMMIIMMDCIYVGVVIRKLGIKS